MSIEIPCFKEKRSVNVFLWFFSSTKNRYFSDSSLMRYILSLVRAVFVFFLDVMSSLVFCCDKKLIDSQILEKGKS